MGLSRLAETLARQPVQLVCLTLLEDYFQGACAVLTALRELGCRAHVAVGGVMPSLTPEHVAAHLPEVSFICRGAGERFVPRLAEIVGTSDITTPFSESQCAALMAMDGLLAVDRAGRRLIAANPRHTARVDDLDAIDLDLSHLQAHHIEGGIEISTARGCDHQCTFCSILGRRTYQARSADGVIRLLDQYQARFAELFGSSVPANAYRVHISDDDFACDRSRAAEILERIQDTPFRLSSVQLSIADLCRRRGGQLLVEIHDELIDALRPECFADHGRDISATDLMADYRPRAFSSYLQIGVESFCDRELSRLAKGYRVAHVRLAVRALAVRGIHLDAYCILSGSETTAADLVDSLEEIGRLKLRHPIHFHLRYPTVKRLVSYFPSVSHRVKLRQGKTHRLKLRRQAESPGHPEFDYPFVEGDIAEDRWVRLAVAQSFLTDDQRYTASLERLRELWLERLHSLPEGPEQVRGEQLVRRLDDAPRRLVFEQLSEARRRDSRVGKSVDRADVTVALEAATELLGHPDRWLGAFRRFEGDERPRLVVIPTWQCELRCRYCYIAKQDGRVMARRTLRRSVDLLLGCCRPEVLLQFFGGEPLVEWQLVQYGIEYATEQARHCGHSVSFIVSTNGWSLDEAKLSWLARHPVRLELSLDGDPEIQNRYRHALEPEDDSYVTGIAPRVEAIVASGLAYDVIMVVHPDNVDRLAGNFFHIADLGFRRIQVNFGLGARWRQGHQESFAKGLHQIGNELRRRWSAGEILTMVNLESKPLPMRLNGEVTVDYDGTIYGGNGFLHETEHKSKFIIGHLDDQASFDRYRLDGPDNDYLLEWTYPPDITANNLAVGRIMCSFVRWMQKAGIGVGYSGTP